jgi:hypothetical protein
MTLRRRAPPPAPPPPPSPGAADALAALAGFPGPPPSPPPAPPTPPSPAQGPSPIAGLPNSLAGAGDGGPLARLQVVLHRADLTPEPPKWVPAAGEGRGRAATVLGGAGRDAGSE